MCNNCLTKEECDCPSGTSLVHCNCDPYYEKFCSACGHEPWTTGKASAEKGATKTRRASSRSR